MTVLTINYYTGSGSGKMELNLENFLPCSVHHFKILIDTINKSDDRDEIAATLNGYIIEQAEKLKKDREIIDAEREKTALAKINAELKKYIGLNALLVKEYNADEITDGDATIKIKAATVYALRLNKDRMQEAQAFDGWMFTKAGYTFDVFKDGTGKTADFIIMVHGTGLQLTTTRKKSEIVASVTPRLLDILTQNAAKLEAARENFKKFMIAAGFIEADPENENTNGSNAGENNENTNEKKEDQTMKRTENTNNEKYFAGVKTLDELRSVYRDLLKANHPDNGGSTEKMQDINAAYKEAFDLLKAGAKLDDEKEKIKWSEAEDAAIREALYKVVHLDGLNIEIVGCWIWIDGNTYAARDTLKEAGYTWSKARHKWHFAPYEKKFYKGSKKSFDQIRREYGSAEVENEAREKIAG